MYKLITFYVHFIDDEPPSAPPPAPPMAEAESDTLSPEEIAVVLKMQDQRRNYLPEASEKFDGEDEMEMVICYTLCK